MNKVAIYPGTFDPITYGHIDVIKKSLKLFDKIVVGVSDVSNKNYLFNSDERIEIVRNIKFVDLCVPQEDDNKILAWNKLQYHKLFVGDDWFLSDKWKDYERELKSNNVSITYFPYTKGTSSTKINKILDQFR